MKLSLVKKINEKEIKSAHLYFNTLIIFILYLNYSKILDFPCSTKLLFFLKKILIIKLYIIADTNTEIYKFSRKSFYKAKKESEYAVFTRYVRSRY